MKNYISLFIMLVVSFGLSVSCSDYLNVDDYFDDELKLDSVFKEKRLIEAYMWGAANLFSDEGQIFSTGSQYTPGPLATDEAFTMFNITGATSYSGMRFVQGYIRPNDLGPFLNTWKNSYKIIRKCNTIINRIDEATDMTTDDKFYILGYTYFIRAYAYYNILIDFGPPILLGDELVETNESMGYYNRSRSTYDEAIEYICGEFEKAAKYIPDKVPLINFGRPTKGAAYALVARLRLQHASPLFNGGQVARTYYSNWMRKEDGVNYISQTPNEERWAIAAAAAKRVMDMELGGEPLYSLYTVKSDGFTPSLPKNVRSDSNFYEDYPFGAAGIDHLKSYSDMFTGEAVSAINKELIWGRNSDGLTSYTRASFPVTKGGWNGMAVTQKVIDAYFMLDGKTIHDSSIDYPYSENGFSSSIKTFSEYRLNAGVYNMYINREMRFYASIGFSECFWPALSATSSGDYNYTISYYFDAEDGKSNPDAAAFDHTPTGYVIKKYIHKQDAWQGTNAYRMKKVFPIIRYAEILLSYAEALNNLTTTHTIELDGQTHSYSRDIQEIKSTFNLIRYRAGLPGLTNEELSDPKKIQKLIEKERMIEFLFENRRYYDVRRWGIYEESENEPITGMNIEASKEGYYSRVIPNTARIGSRIVNKKMIFLPLPKDELQRIPLLDQNPGWEE